MKTALASSIVTLCLMLGTAAHAAKAPASAMKIADADAEVRQRHAKAIDLLMASETKSAIKILKGLESKTMSADEKDRVQLTLGRALYQAGDFDGALQAYEEVRRGGPSWLEALEERSWTFLRMGQFEDALALLKTVLSPVYVGQVASEPYFMAAYGYLRICDYPSVLRTIELFKERFRKPMATWEKSGTPEAKAKLAELQETVQKINLVDAEVIQRLYLDESGKRLKGEPPKIARGKNDMTFPADPTDTREVWFDEIENFRVTSKGCPSGELSAGKQAESKEKPL